MGGGLLLEIRPRSTLGFGFWSLGGCRSSAFQGALGREIWSEGFRGRVCRLSGLGLSGFWGVSALGLRVSALVLRGFWFNSGRGFRGLG